jgi:hypothetical protein
LKDKEPKDNQYLDIFYIWLAKVIQLGGLRETDLLQVIMDSRTCEYLEQTDTIMGLLLDKLPCSFTLVSVEPPANSLEGMMNKYAFTEYTQDVYIYCDIDILISNPFHMMVEQLEEDTMYFCNEGVLSDLNYGDGFSESKDILKNMAGFSAGKFVILGKALRDSFFKTIHDMCDYSTKFYTVEQPYFNKAIYLIPRDKVNVNTAALTEYVAFNGNGYNKEKTIFNDMAGNVGDGKAHASKIMNALSLYLIGFY